MITNKQLESTKLAFSIFVDKHKPKFKIQTTEQTNDTIEMDGISIREIPDLVKVRTIGKARILTGYVVEVARDYPGDYDTPPDVYIERIGEPVINFNEALTSAVQLWAKQQMSWAMESQAYCDILDE